jgi:hypothetical protein
LLLSKTIEFKNMAGQKVKVVEIPVLELKHRDYFMIQARLQNFMTNLYNNPQEKTCFSFRDFLKHKISWSEFEEVYKIEEFKNNA